MRKAGTMVFWCHMYEGSEAGTNCPFVKSSKGSLSSCHYIVHPCRHEHPHARKLPLILRRQKVTRTLSQQKKLIPE